MVRPPPLDERSHMLSHILNYRLTLAAFNKVFSRSMPYGTYLEVTENPATVSVIYKGETIWSLTNPENPTVDTKLSDAAQNDIVTALTNLLPETKNA